MLSIILFAAEKKRGGEVLAPYFSAFLFSFCPCRLRLSSICVSFTFFPGVFDQALHAR